MEDYVGEFSQVVRVIPRLRFIATKAHINLNWNSPYTQRLSNSTDSK